MTSHPDHVPIARIDRLVVTTPHLDRLHAFYAGQLGAQTVARHGGQGEGRAVLLDFCGVGLELIEALPRHRDAARAHLVFSLGSADAVDELSARLALAGHSVIAPPARAGDGCYRSTVLDPDGNRVGLTV